MEKRPHVTMYLSSERATRLANVDPITNVSKLVGEAVDFFTDYCLDGSVKSDRMSILKFIANLDGVTPAEVVKKASDDYLLNRLSEISENLKNSQTSSSSGELGNM